MTWDSLDTYQQFVEMHPDLNEQKHREAFTHFLNRMWTKPATLTEFTKAYMEFTTSANDALTFPKLNALKPAQTSNSCRKKTKRTRRRRSRRNRKKPNT